MIVLRYLAVLILPALLTGCGLLHDVKKVKADITMLKAYLKEYRPETQCGPPGTSQPMVCNYRLFVKNTSGDLFKAYVDPKLVEEGETACKTVFENKDSKTYDDDQDVVYEDFKCPTKRTLQLYLV